MIDKIGESNFHKYNYYHVTRPLKYSIDCVLKYSYGSCWQWKIHQVSCGNSWIDTFNCLPWRRIWFCWHSEQHHMRPSWIFYGYEAWGGGGLTLLTGGKTKVWYLCISPLKSSCASVKFIEDEGDITGQSVYRRGAEVYSIFCVPTDDTGNLIWYSDKGLHLVSIFSYNFHHLKFILCRLWIR